MAKKSVALIGPGSGPSVRLNGAKARVQVRGLKGEEFALVVQELNDTEDIVMPVQGDGIFELIRCAYARVIYEGDNRSFIACVLIGSEA